MRKSGNAARGMGKTLEKCLDRMYEKAKALGGLVSGERGSGYAKKGYLKNLYGEKPIALMEGMKKILDEKGFITPVKL